MRRKGRLLHSSILTAALFVFAAPAFAAEPAPGDVCANLNYIISTGGPETSGIHRLLRCDGTNWQLMMTIDASGHVGIGNPTPGAALDVLSADTVGDIFPAIFGGSTTEGVTLVVNNWESNHHQAQIAFQDQWYVGNSSLADATDDFYIYNKATTSFPFGISPGNSVNLNAAFALTGDITPAQITANQNDYNPAGLAGASVLRLSSDASRNITSIAGGADGRVITIMNVGSFPIVLKNDDGATGTAANRFAFTGDLTLAAKQSAMLMYDSTASRWRQIANGTATGSGDNLGNHIATANIQLGSYWLSGDGGNEGLFVENDGNGGLVSNNGNAAFIITSPLSDANTAIALRSRGSGMDREAAVWADQAGALHLKTNTFGDAILFDDGNGTSVGAFTSTRFENKVATLISGDISPAQITANQNNYNPANLAKASVLRLTSDASRNITSLAGGVDGRILTVMNVGSFPIVLKNDDGATGTAANRFALTGDLTLAAKQSAMLMYDSTASRWRQIANGTATGSGDNLGNHTATANIQLGSNWLSGDGGNEGLKIDSTGHITVGPGTDASQEAVVPWLYVNTTSDGGISVRDSTANAEQVMVLWGGVAYLGPVTNTPLAFQTNDTERMRIVESGNVGIGTATPADSLHVYEATPGESAGITIGNDGTGVSQQSWLNLITKGDGSHPLATAGVKGWQIWANADASSALGYSGGANGLGIGYTDGSSWNNVALVIQPTDRLGIFNPYPEAGLDVGTSVALSGDITPAQITANQNNYNPANLSTASVLRLSSNASRNVTSLAGGTDGRVITLMNVGSFPIVLKNDDGATGTAANRFALTGDLTLAAKQSAMLMYDSTASRWRQVANGTAAGSGDNLGNHTATQNIVLGANYLSGDGGNEGISIDSSGKTGIGTASPATMLDVNGDITNRNVANCTQLGTDSTGKLVCQGVAIPTMALISTQTASASASLQFTGLPTTYNTVLLNCAGLLLSADAGIRVQVGQGAGPTWNTSAKYSVSSIYTATGFTGNANTYNSSTESDLTGEALFTDTASPMSLKMYIDNISSSSIAKVATFHSSGSKDSPASSYGVYTINGMGFWNNDTNPVTAIRLITTGGTMTSGTCSLYGMN